MTGSPAHQTYLTFCAGKQKFESRTLAETVNRRRKRKNLTSTVYKCKGCSKYHIGDRHGVPK